MEMELFRQRQLLLQLTGEVRGLRWAMKVLIATHPHPEHLQQLWRQQLPDVVDEVTEPGSGTSEEEQEGWKKTLAQLSAQIAAAQ